MRYEDSRPHQVCLQVILDRGLATMYGVATKELIGVSDAKELTAEDAEGRGGTRAFTAEDGK